MQFKLRIPAVPFILLCDVRNMLKFAFELQAFLHILYTEERNAVYGVSQSFFDISS